MKKHLLLLSLLALSLIGCSDTKEPEVPIVDPFEDPIQLEFSTSNKFDLPSELEVGKTAYFTYTTDKGVGDYSFSCDDMNAKFVGLNEEPHFGGIEFTSLEDDTTISFEVTPADNSVTYFELSFTPKSKESEGRGTYESPFKGVLGDNTYELKAGQEVWFYYIADKAGSYTYSVDPESGLTGNSLVDGQDNVTYLYAELLIPENGFTYTYKNIKVGYKILFSVSFLSSSAEGSATVTLSYSEE